MRPHSMPEQDLPAQQAPQGRLSAGSKPMLAALAVLVACVLLLLAAEGAVRLRQYWRLGSASSLEQAYTYDAALQLRVPVAGYSNGRIVVNSQGFRGPEIAKPKPPGTLRLAFLGASTTWCAEVSGNAQVWPHLVTESLGREFPGSRLDYVNAGVPGYTLEPILRNLNLRVAPLKPDVIVIYEAANNLSGELRDLARSQGLVAEGGIELSSLGSRYSLLWSLAEKNLRILMAQRSAQSNQGRLVVDAGTLGKEYRQSLTRLVRAAQQQAPVVAVATFSIQPRSEQPAEQQLRASASALFYMPFMTPASIIQAYDQYNRIIREVARDTGALLIEGERDIPGDAQHFTDSVHFSDAGSRLMAQRVSRALAASERWRTLLPR